MNVGSSVVSLKNGMRITLRSAIPVDTESLLKHLITTHLESYKNLNQSAGYWSKFSVSDEEKF